MGKTIVILGGGVGGLVAANELRAKLSKEHRIVLVDRETTFVFAPSLLWVMTGDRTAQKISRPLARLQRKGIDLICGEIQGIDPKQRQVTVQGQTLTADYLVIALGADLAPDTVPGLSAAGHNFYSLGGAESFRDAFREFSGGRLVVLTSTPAYKCPAAPYEASMLLEAACRERRIRDRTEIHLYAAEPGPMGVAGPDVSKAVRQMVESKGILYHPEHQILRADAQSRELTFANGVLVRYDLLAYVPPHRAPRVVQSAGLAPENGWIAVNRNTLETVFPGVYALGDVVSIPLKMGKPLPKAGVFAHGEASVIVRSIVRQISGKGKMTEFDGEGECFIETGDGKAGFGSGNFFAEPLPEVKVHPPARRWHAAKVLFEKDWLRRWF